MLCAVKSERHSYIDCLRNMCEKAGYIAKGDTAGIFIKVKELPDNMTVAELHLQYERLIGNNIRKQVLQYASVVSDSFVNKFINNAINYAIHQYHSSSIK